MLWPSSHSRHFRQDRGQWFHGDPAFHHRSCWHSRDLLWMWSWYVSVCHLQGRLGFAIGVHVLIFCLLVQCGEVRNHCRNFSHEWKSGRYLIFSNLFKKFEMLVIPTNATELLRVAPFSGSFQIAKFTSKFFTLSIFVRSHEPPRTIRYVRGSVGSFSRVHSCSWSQSFKAAVPIHPGMPLSSPGLRRIPLISTLDAEV